MVELKEPNVGGTATLPHKVPCLLPRLEVLGPDRWKCGKTDTGQALWLIYGKNAAVCSLTPGEPFLPLHGGVLKIQFSYQSQWMLTTGLCLGVDQHFSPRVGYTRWGLAD